MTVFVETSDSRVRLKARQGSLVLGFAATVFGLQPDTTLLVGKTDM